MKSLSKLVKIILAIIIFLILIQVMVANRLTNAGLNLTDLMDQEQKLKEENELLERKIATSSSLTQISERAAEVGFIKPETFYLIPEVSVALEKQNFDAPR